MIMILKRKFKKQNKLNNYKIKMYYQKNKIMINKHK